MNNDIWTPEHDDWETEPAFELEVVRKGVGKGKRHFSFKQYLGWLIKNDYSKDEAKKPSLLGTSLIIPRYQSRN